MKSLLLTSILFLCGLHSIAAQNISITVGEMPEPGEGTQFSLHNGSLSVTPNRLVLGERDFFRPHSWSVSPDGRKISLLLKESVFTYKLFDSNGSQYYEKELEFFNLRDETAKNYQFDDGSSVLRDNVANFSFYSSSGEQIFSISNSSQSTEGELQSELSADKNGKTIVLYNPVINYGSATGSRASLVTKNRELNTFFRDREREIRDVYVTSGGEFITMVAGPASGNDEYSAFVFDRFGNKLFEMSTEEELIGVELTENADYVTLFSSARMQVYRLNDGERIGSASSRNSILHAMYDPQENMMVAFGGSMNGFRVSNPSITVVHIGQREIESREIESTLNTLDKELVRLSKTGEQQYSVQNLDRSLNVETSF